MAKNTDVIPFTEIQERVLDIGRVPLNSIQKVRGDIRDVYLREIALKWDWDFYISSSALTTDAVDTTPTVTANTGASSLTFSSTPAGINGKFIKISGNNNVYQITSSSGSITPTLQGNSNLTSASCSIFKTRYSLASDFDRYPKNMGPYRIQGGRPNFLFKKSNQDFNAEYTSGYGTPEIYRFYGVDTKNCPVIEINPPPRTSENLYNEYLRKPRLLKDNTLGTISVGAGTDLVQGQGARFTDSTTGDWIRCDAFGTHDDSEWYQIIAIQNDSTITISPVWGSSSVTLGNFTISSAPDMPAMLHPAVLYGTLRAVTTDQNDPNLQVYIAKFAEAITDAKKVYITRTYSDDFHTIAEEYRYRR